VASNGMKRYKFGMRDRSKWRSLLFFSVIIIVILAITGFFGIRRIYINNLQAVDTSATTDIIYVVESGATPSQIAKGLREKALIRSTAAFEQYVRTNELGQEFKAGTYLLKQSQDVASIVATLTEGRVAANLFTILPGKRLDQIAQAFRDKGFNDADIEEALEPNAYKDHPALVDKPDGVSLEGYLYPDSYEFLIGTTMPQTIVRQSLDEMAEALSPDIRAGISAQGLSIYQGITLASIVEREVGAFDSNGVPSDNRPKAAQVFLKRLREGIRLESNTTDNLPEEYDTYKIDGLPPTPISNISTSSLQAVTMPSATNYLFFVSGTDCVTRFSETQTQHETYIAQHGVATDCKG